MVIQEKPIAGLFKKKIYIYTFISKPINLAWSFFFCCLTLFILRPSCRPQGRDNSLWADEEKIQSLQCDQKTSQPPDVRRPSQHVIWNSLSCSIICIEPMDCVKRKIWLINLQGYLIFSLCWLNYSLLPQVPLAAGEWPNYWMHSSTVLQRQVQTHPAIPSPPMFTSGTGAKAYLPPARGKTL